MTAPAKNSSPILHSYTPVLAWLEIMREVSYDGKVRISDIDQIPDRLRKQAREAIVGVGNQLLRLDARSKLVYRNLIILHDPSLTENFDLQFSKLMQQAKEETIADQVRELLKASEKPRPKL